MLDASLPKTRTGRFWVYVGDDDNRYTIYDYTPSRKRDGPQSFLKDYTGYLVADAFAGYDGIYTTQNVTQVLCWAHARRKFHDAQRVQSLESQVALAFIARLYQVEREARNAQPESCLANASIRQEWFEQRLQLRQTHSRPILGQFHVGDSRGCSQSNAESLLARTGCGRSRLLLARIGSKFFRAVLARSVASRV